MSLNAVGATFLSGRRLELDGQRTGKAAIKYLENRGMSQWQRGRLTRFR